ncbi:hypothetical protein NPIL_580131 [Nephila pilipes]|uniref:Uncharacterized protein n=1 Tax=Nephila pilipes TaxID=299642 RepID=A0A8X6IV08_NEPPI|nr:hypothetical protein NPIL_107921 [Nephila pilipes]GFS59183.1 hypothetical protein NPIL_319031 [Nephila pilipes]GFT42861.1 hypothetical protein NPIL_228361 [Nephila pilipes]GFU40257.1 hypothetical protein NPIL_580131 [Nephila pilipes]
MRTHLSPRHVLPSALLPSLLESKASLFSRLDSFGFSQPEVNFSFQHCSIWCTLFGNFLILFQNEIVHADDFECVSCELEVEYEHILGYSCSDIDENEIIEHSDPESDSEIGGHLSQPLGSIF